MTKITKKHKAWTIDSEKLHGVDEAIALAKTNATAKFAETNQGPGNPGGETAPRGGGGPPGAAGSPRGGPATAQGRPATPSGPAPAESSDI